MKITDKLNKETIVFLTKESRTDAIEELLNQLVKYNYLEKSVKLFSFIESQELKNSSDIGRGVALPHSISKEIQNLVCILGISKNGISYNNDSIHPCHIVLLSLSPNNKPDVHRKFISKFQLLMTDPILKQKIINANSTQELEKILIQWETKQIEEEL